MFLKFIFWIMRRLLGKVADATAARLDEAGASAGKPSFEVERKFKIDLEELENIQSKLRDLGFIRESRVEMEDVFLPAGSPEEMIRVRSEDDGRASLTTLTLKRWVQVAGGREREERESKNLDETVRDCLLDLGGRLGGDLLKDGLPSFRKTRVSYGGYRSPFEVTVSLDDVEGLGEYSGHYLEVEVITEHEHEVARARSFVVEFAAEILGGKREEAISYMEMLRRSKATA